MQKILFPFFLIVPVEIKLNISSFLYAMYHSGNYQAFTP